MTAEIIVLSKLNLQQTAMENRQKEEVYSAID